MNVNDRFALELGRAIVRALIAEAERDQAKADLVVLQDKETENAEERRDGVGQL